MGTWEDKESAKTRVYTAEAFGVGIKAQSNFLKQVNIHFDFGNDRSKDRDHYIYHPKKELERMPRRSTPGKPLIAGCALLLVVGLGAWRVSTRPALGDGVGRTSVGVRAMAPGEVALFGGSLSLGARKGTVAVRSVRMTGVPDGMEVVGIHGVNIAEGSRRIGAGRGEPAANGITVHPVSDVRVTAGETEWWYVLFVVRITKPGTWTTTGVDVSWRQGWRRGTQHYEYTVQVTTDP